MSVIVCLTASDWEQKEVYLLYSLTSAINWNTRKILQVIKQENQNHGSFVKSGFTVSAKLADPWPKWKQIIVIVLFHLVLEYSL